MSNEFLSRSCYVELFEIAATEAVSHLDPTEVNEWGVIGRIIKALADFYLADGQSRCSICSRLLVSDAFDSENLEYNITYICRSRRGSRFSKDTLNRSACKRFARLDTDKPGALHYFGHVVEK